MPPHPSSGTLIRIGNNSDDLSVLLALFLKCFTSRAASRGDIVRRLLLESADTSTIGNNHDRRVRGLLLAPCLMSSLRVQYSYEYPYC